MRPYQRQFVARPPSLDKIADVIAATQDAVRDVTDPLVRTPILEDGRIVENVTIAATATDVPHLLQRRFRGWWLTRCRGAATVTEATTQTDDTRFLTLIASAPVAVDIYVFA